MEYHLRTEVLQGTEVVFDGCQEQPVDLTLSLPDYCPDIQRILKCQIYPCITSKSIVGDSLEVNGNTMLRILYVDSVGLPIRCCEKISTFTTNIPMKKTLDNPIAFVKAKVEYVNCRATSPRKLDIHGAFSVCAKVLEHVPQDIFVEVGHGPTLIDNNIMLSDASLRFATEGVALVHNLICGALTCVGGGTGPRYTPYHMPHRTEVMGFMTVLHGDDRFYNNIFVQKWPSDDIITMHDSDDGFDTENRAAGTWMFDEYPTYDEWISQFDFSKPADMAKLYGAHEGKLPVWIEGNAYLGGAKPSKKDVNALISAVAREDVRVELVQKEDGYYLDTNVYELIEGFKNRMIDSDVLGKAFEPEERFENPDGTAIRFDSDYFGTHRGVDVIPGPFAGAEEAAKVLY